MRFLLVDDYPAGHRLMREILAGPGHEFLEADTGAQAVAAFALHHPDWVLTDLDMPEMDGLEATGAIRDRDPAARIVIVTQHDDDNLRDAARTAGARAFLPKDHLLELPELLTAS